jgi:hypothetical protein
LGIKRLTIHDLSGSGGKSMLLIEALARNGRRLLKAAHFPGFLPTFFSRFAGMIKLTERTQKENRTSMCYLPQAVMSISTDRH